MVQTESARSINKSDTFFNFFLRLGVSVTTTFVHLTYFWPNIGKVTIAAMVFHAFIYAPALHFLPVSRTYRNYKLLIDSIVYGGCIAAWGFNLFLATLYLTSASFISIAAGGARFCVRSIVLMLLAAGVGGFFTDWRMSQTLPLPTMALAASFIFIFMTLLGGKTYGIAKRLRQTRANLREQTEELQNLNDLAIAVNSHLSVDVIMQNMMTVLERIYPFEALYILSLDSSKKKLKVTGIYGSSITETEHSAFREFELDIEKDKNSVFVYGLINKKVSYFPNITPSMMMKLGTKIDKDIYAVKPSISLAYFPINVDEEVIAGAAFINYQQHLVLDCDDIERIKRYIIQIGTAVRNVNLFTAQEEAKQQAEQAQQKAEASEEAKGRFLANMSHEIRTPLTSIMGYSEALTEAGLSREEQQKYIGNIVRSGDHLLSMINDILDISKIEATKIEIEHISCNLVEILCEIESYSKIKCKDKALSFDIEVEYPIPRTIYSDPTRLKQILLNLCNNAIKFTSQGSITLKLKFSEPNQLEIEVKDTGIGIDKGEQQKIFSAFEQADTSTTRLYGGTGLGLYISKNLAQLLGGDLTVYSQKNKGSQFTLTTKVGQYSNLITSPNLFTEAMRTIRETKTHFYVPRLKGRILIAEDNLENQNLVARLIGQTGIETDIVSNGEEAVLASQKQSYSLIFLDMQMPVMGGVEAAKSIKNLGIETPLVAFTANVMKHQISEYKDLGFAAILEKPLNRHKLFSILIKHLDSQETKPKKVLIAEDNEVNQMILQRYVTKSCAEAEVILVDNGIDAVLKSETNNFDLILMDMKMPGMDGLEATQKIRENKIKTPIYIVSGNIEKSDQENCISAGASGHIAKPICASLMKNLLSKHLE